MEYCVVSEIESVPEMTELGTPAISSPPSQGACFDMSFPHEIGLDFARYEPAVGARCRVIRTSEARSEEECTGAVLQVSPIVRVSADGEGWRSA